ncbi:MAG: glycosyltransferase family 1 protein [Novosphingobium sp.]
MSQDGNAILVNGRFLMQSVTGVQRVARELVAEMDKLVGAGETSLRLAIACEPDANVSGLGLRHIAIERRGGARGHAWEQFVLPRMLAGRRLLCLGNTVPLASALGARRVSVMIHDVSYLSVPQAYSFLYRAAHRALLPILLCRCGPLFTVCDVEAERLRRFRRGTRLFTLQNGAWPHDKVDRACSGERQRMVLYVGSLSRRKNVERVIEVAHHLAREDGVRTVLVGAGNEILAPIRTRVASDVAHMLDFVGQVPDLETLAGYYRRAACLLFPSLYEASPLPPLEAMSFGCPVIASAIPAMTERCGAAALYCDPLDSSDILTAVRRVLNNPAQAESLREAGFVRAAQYSWRDQARALLAVMTGS